MNKELGTRALATKSVVEQLQSETARTTPMGSVTVRGREHPIDVFEVASLGAEVSEVQVRLAVDATA